MSRYIVKEYGVLTKHSEKDLEYGVDYLDTKTGQLFTLQFCTDTDYTETEIAAKLNGGQFAEYMAEFAETIGGPDNV